MIIETVSEAAQSSVSLSKVSISFGLWLLIFELGRASVWIGLSRLSRLQLSAEPILKNDRIGSTSRAGGVVLGSRNIGSGARHD